MPMKLIPLGTAGMSPTRTKNLASFLLDYNGELFLFDIGECSQRQLLRAKIRRNRIDYIFISHWHADHVSGLPGLLHTLNTNHREKDLFIFGPKGTKKQLSLLIETFGLKELSFKIIAKEISAKKPHKIMETEHYEFYAVPLNHTTPTLGYVFKEKDKWKINKTKLYALGLKEGKWLNNIKQGKAVKISSKKIMPKDVAIFKKGRKFVYITDTRPNKYIRDACKDANLAVIECMFSVKHKHRAIESKHLTTEEVAKIAEQSNIKKLLITHFSQRYKNPRPLLNEIKKIYKNVELAKELKIYSIT